MKKKPDRPDHARAKGQAAKAVQFEHTLPDQKIRKRADEICRNIKEWIVQHGLQPGDRLPQEPDLVRIFAASKGTVREALKAAQTQGFIKVRTGPGGGAFISAVEQDRAHELLSNYFFFQPPSITDIYEIRKRLEPDLVVSLVGTLQAEDFQRLETTLLAYEHPAADRDEEYRQRLAELDFNRELAALCPNPILGFMCSFLHRLLQNLEICKHIYDMPNPELREHALHYQIRLLQALKREDANAAREVMFDHMCAAQAYMEACEVEVRQNFVRMKPSPADKV